MNDASSIDRREALRRVALLLGGGLSAPAIAGVLAGCTGGAGEAGEWNPRAFSVGQGEMVAVIAEHILPRTTTPGARDAGVHRFIDVMMAEYYLPAERARFAAGLADLDARADRAHGRRFLRCDDSAQRSLLLALDAEAFAQPRPPGDTPWYRTMKELTVLGYYTSEPGATKELRHEPVPGRYEGCVPLARVGRAWAV